ncbi:MAG TPA: glucosaminidase domain-containing protein [Polyangiaceae bacterium]|nr:glucosaminidase domain-containing protein [Polyangiaceae bacterium]
MIGRNSRASATDGEGMIAAIEGPAFPEAVSGASTVPPRSGAHSRPPSSSFRALAGGLTTIGEARASECLAQAYRAVTGSAPSPRTLDLLWAQWALETARGQAMYGNNFAGIKASARSSGALLATSEGHGKDRRRTTDRFRTYGTPEDGARDYVSLLARRYPDAFSALRAGDVQGFAEGLQRGHYFTAHPQSYRTGLERLASEHQNGVSAAPPSPVAELALDGLRWALEKSNERE